MLGKLFKDLFKSHIPEDANKYGVDTVQALYKYFPALSELEETMENNKSLLIEPYIDYAANFSHPIWALSHLSATLCRSACLLLQPEKILDLGSGFSSYVFRSYAKECDHACVVHTVDDDTTWLNKTRDYLIQ